MIYDVPCINCSTLIRLSRVLKKFGPIGRGSLSLRTRSYLFCTLYNCKMNSTRALNCQYEEAVKTLNSLQSNSVTVELVKRHKNLRMSNNITETQKYLNRIGITLNVLDKLPVIHIAGTKGKGSTCAFVESILREHGLKTGFYSSPHLVAVRERIRINGLPIDKREFSHYFWDVYDNLYEQKSDEKDMPAYFKFLTILAFKVFLKEDVDVAIVEVGIGGEFDCTNVLRRPAVCGIASLDIDHTSILGETIEEISWHKAGVIKSHVPVFTVRQQPQEALKVLYERSKEKQSKLYVSPPLENYDWGGRLIHLGLSGYVQFLNASLALQLSHYFLKNRSNLSSDSISKDENFCGKPFTLTEEDIFALENVVWPGRSQIVTKERMTYFLDGAHTITSIQSCIDWYEKISLQVPNDNVNLYKILLFNLTGDRDHEVMLEKLFSCDFDAVLFTTNLITKNMTASSDQTNFNVSDAKQISRCQSFRKYWLRLSQEDERKKCQQCLTFQCISDAFSWITCEKDSTDQINVPLKLREAEHIQVLVTGSLHLIGGVLSVLDPTLAQPAFDGDSTNQSMVDIVRRKFTQSRYSTPGAP
ncbi:Folylpolyglutamate synthase, mitochondrial [Armadillidium nasatum]|uniref:Folylpolyglutamate synthase n=1 Tax=Armadillidium nasatum TaxID=96803 RepID=A0A5N5SHZ9_9CRUS|nr:Folylpolyglutamate synthase, mitochondrial [Armadillidium nasatum]